MLPLLIEAYKTDQERLLEAIKGMGFFIDLAMGEIGDAYLETKQDIIRHQQDAIRELSTPVLQLRDGLLILPLIGVLDSFRANQVTQHLLHAIRDRRARVVVIDITGVPTVDSAVANHLIQTVDASRLMGTETIITGLSADIAQTLVRLGVDLTKLNTKGDLQHGVDTALRLIHYKTVRIREEPATYDPMDEGNE
ncbi:MAG: STAS domain-containing protein [Chloroflexi bacterium]|nr:STAS domain-containing protein [Chloroflexota bacterium]